MQQININELKPHPRNTEFFDDMTGEKWNEFLESIRTSGVIEPIVVTTDMIIVSGHQRVRACKELNIETVPCTIKHYKDEDSVIKDLLETNIRQRGDIGGSDKQIIRRIKELERIYGIQHGAKSFQGNQYAKVKPNNSDSPKTQKELAAMLGMSVDTLQNYKLLAEMIPEIEDLVDTGIVSKTTALAMIKNLSEQEQLELISSLDTTKKITQKKVEEYIENQKSKTKDNTELLTKVKKLENQVKDLESVNDTLQRSKELSDEIANKYKARSDEYDKFKSQVINLSVEPDGALNMYTAASELTKFHREMEKMILETLAPMKYQKFMLAVKCDDTLKQNFVNTLNLVNEWYESMLDFIGDNKNTDGEIIDMEEFK